MLEKIKSSKEVVKRLLEKNKSFRDSDNKLIAAIWWTEAVESNPHLTAKDFLLKLGRGELTSSESIRRARQKVQEQEPALRGENYKGRQAEEKVVREGIGDV